MTRIDNDDKDDQVHVTFGTFGRVDLVEVDFTLVKCFLETLGACNTK